MKLRDRFKIAAAAFGISQSIVARAPAPAVGTPALPDGVSPSLARILRPQAAYRWMLPSLAAITPQYVEMVLRSALAGGHVQQWELFDLMFDTWPELAACAQELTDGVSCLKMIFEPFAEEDEDPTPEAVERCKLVSSALRRMAPDAAADENDLEGTLADIIDGWFRGVTALETDWQVASSAIHGTMVAPRATFWVHPVCFAWDQSGRLGLRVDAKGQLSPANLSNASHEQPSVVGAFPPHKFLLGIHKAKSGTALGGALLRPLAWWWCAANFSADWLLNLAQIFGLPFRWANYDPTASQETVDRICSMLQNMGSAGWAAFPAGTTMELKEAAGKTGDHSPQGELLDRADRYARLLILGQTQSGGKGSSLGGQAFGKVESDVKKKRIEAAGRYACRVFNTQLIPSILTLNYGDADEAPKMRLLEDEEGGLDEAQRDEILSRLMPLSQSFLRKKYGQPEPQGDGDAIGGAPEPEEEERSTSNAQRATSRAKKPVKARDDSSALARIAAIADDEQFTEALAIFARDVSGEARDQDGKWTAGGRQAGDRRASYKPMSKEKLRIGIAQEAIVAKAVGGKNLPDNEPFDVLVGKHALEVKTIIDGKTGRIIVNRESRERKEKFARKHKLKAATVAIDARTKPPTYYTRDGVGAFSITSMRKVSLKELKEIFA